MHIKVIRKWSNINRYERKFCGRKRLQELSKITGHRYFSCKSWFYNNHYIRIYRGGRSKYFKKVCNKKLRKMKEVHNTTYHKLTEFWWEIY